MISSVRLHLLRRARGLVMASSARIDPTQETYLKEECILVDDDDRPIGSASKRRCHLLTNIQNERGGMLHRAFSVFLFNRRSELLLQKRSDVKVTFPGFWTNTCCSHPLHVEPEMVESEQLGVRKAAQRKLKHELGISEEQVPLDSIEYLTRIHYKAPSDDQWGEHEIDYILFVQQEVDIHADPNEVSDYKYVSVDQLKEMISTAESKGVRITPWFKLISDSFLYKWWENLASLQSQKNHQTIHRML